MKQFLFEEITNRAYILMFTNKEVRDMFYGMVKSWFTPAKDTYGEFITSLLMDNVEAMNEYMNEITLEIFSYFNAGSRSVRSASEKFYHGFVLGLMVELRDRYIITSNRESNLIG